MRYILIALLIIVFGYSLALVLQNPTELPVDLLFTQVPAMRLGLLLLLTLALGIVVGLLLGVQVFRVFQKSWEIKRLRKDIDHLRKEQIQSAQLAAAEAAANVRHEKTVVDIYPQDKNSTLYNFGTTLYLVIKSSIFPFYIPHYPSSLKSLFPHLRTWFNRFPLLLADLSIIIALILCDGRKSLEYHCCVGR